MNAQSKVPMSVRTVSLFRCSCGGTDEVSGSENRPYITSLSCIPGSLLRFTFLVAKNIDQGAVELRVTVELRIFCLKKEESGA